MYRKGVFVLFVMFAVFAGAFAAPARAQEVRVVAAVDIATQSMTVHVDNVLLYTWPVSTARPGKVTPLGTFTPYWLSPNHVSSIYNSPMPWSVFFNGDYAVHGTSATGALGTPASMGCVRVTVENAEIFFRLVQQYGMTAVRVHIR